MIPLFPPPRFNDPIREPEADGVHRQPFLRESWRLTECRSIPYKHSTGSNHHGDHVYERTAQCRHDSQVGEITFLMILICGCFT